MVRETLTFVALTLQLVGALLALVVPLTLFAYLLLGYQRMHYFPVALQATDFVIKPLDRLLMPLLARAAALTVQADHEILSLEDPDAVGADGGVVLRGEVVTRRAKRVLLGLLVLNVAASTLAVVALALFVGIVRGL